MPLALQPKLLRVLSDGRLRRVGGNQEFAFDVRVIAATNRDPLRAIADGQLRDDLYYRLNVVPINLPPLRERQEDIPMLVQYFIGEFNRKHHLSEKSKLPTRADDILKAYSWPGNVRKLRNIIGRASVLTGSEWIDESSLSPYVRKAGVGAHKLIFSIGTATVADVERELITENPRTIRQQQGRSRTPTGRRR